MAAGVSSLPSVLPQHRSPRELCFVGGWISLFMTGSHYVTLTSLERFADQPDLKLTEIPPVSASVGLYY